MIGVDTNVLVHSSDGDSTFHPACRDLIRGSRLPADHHESLCLTWSVVYEFLRVVTHGRILRQPFAIAQAWEFIPRLQGASHIRILGPGPEHSVAAARMLRAPGLHGNLVHDAHIAAVLAEHGVRRIYTFDQDMRRFPGLEVLDPLG